MELDQIRAAWKNQENNDIKACVEIWDSASGNYKSKPLPDWETNDFLKLLGESIDSLQDKTVLDIGCGAGAYAIALAGRAKSVAGIDISPQMIRFAREKAKDRNVENVEFICGDWNGFEIKKEGYEKKFDVVFAHMTPAVSSAAAFEKLIACSKKHCYFVKPTRRTDPVLDEVKKLAGIEEDSESIDRSIVYAFDIAWQLGYCPHFTYREAIWEMEKSLEEAYAWYIGRVKTYKHINDNEAEKLKEYLKSLLVEGKIHETIETTIVTMYWEVT